MRRLRPVIKFLFAMFFVMAGLNHFLNTSFYLHIMPPYLPRPLLLVYLSGAAEIVLGVLLLIPRWTRAAAWGVVALLVAVFPANLHMAVNGESYPEFSAAALWARLPLQLVLIWWAYRYTKSIRQGEDGGEAVAA